MFTSYFESPIHQVEKIRNNQVLIYNKTNEVRCKHLVKHYFNSQYLLDS